MAAISRHYRPAMLPALIAALHSEVPAVRVQAAAVFAKYRTVFGVRSRELLAAGVAVVDAQEARARAAACREIAACGFVDEATAEALDAIAVMLEAEVTRFRCASARTERIERLVAETLAKSRKDRAAFDPRSPLRRPSYGGMA